MASNMPETRKEFSPAKSTTPPTRPAFFTLPLELRLQIYSYSSLFGLIILTHTSTCAATWRGNGDMDWFVIV
ncbi:hypothetical protein BJ508DRAFT_333555 [Ascobolus immersus RN42]|uniref:F-box domain-containing protein n=1 Tax=Ascobolus immersus RN42 TaxID=1160509 RepID=A0A3N4HM43_ASCIM|nr:hypothetical protein BJ508DRAFT_333555 [Ascobolus immersus RN42]